MWKNDKPRFMRLLRRHYKLCNVATFWVNDKLVIPGRVFFWQEIVYGNYFIGIREIASNLSYVFGVRTFSDVLDGIERFDKTLIYKKR